MFPAIPPGGFAPKLKIAAPAPPPKKKFEFKLGPMLKAVFTWAQEFEHWRVVGFCLIPFVIIIVALVAANAVKRHQVETGPMHTTTQVDAGAWDKVEEVAKADQQMQAYVQTVLTAKARVDTAIQSRDNLHRMLAGAAFETVAARFQAADKEVSNAQQSLAATKRNFDLKYDNYQKIGGKVNYPAQVQ